MLVEKITIIGLDLSLTSTGVAVESDTFTVKSKLRSEPRLDEISTTLLELFDDAVNPVGIIEGYAFSKRATQAFSLGELGGVVKTRLFQNGYPFILVAPAARAKFATGRGNAGKSEVVSSISARTGKVWTGGNADDEIDAWVLEEMGLTHIGEGRLDWPEKNREALEKIDWTPLDEARGYATAVTSRD